MIQENEIFIWDAGLFTEAIVAFVGVKKYKEICDHYWRLIEFEYGLERPKDALDYHRRSDSP